MNNKLELVLHALANWKIEKAYNIVINGIEGVRIDPEAVKLLRQMSRKFGDCYGDGTVFNELKEAILKIGNLLGYWWDEELEKFNKND
tara:strand:- start:1172 stop:1435 length:264 start_codon:yes stop_codon:yes gene_type:complete